MMPDLLAVEDARRQCRICARSQRLFEVRRLPSATGRDHRQAAGGLHLTATRVTQL